MDKENRKVPGCGTYWKAVEEAERKKKEQEGKDVLKNHLSAMDSIDLCDILYKNGVLAKYAKLVNSASNGAVTD